MLAIQLLLGIFMIALTVAVHAVALDVIIRHADNFERAVRRVVKTHWKPIVTSSVVLAVFVSHTIIIWLWALLYHLMACAPLETFSDALYFAAVVYSTLGFGDIVLDESCRMLSGIEGANGFILFSWTAAFIFEIVGQIYRKEAKSL